MALIQNNTTETSSEDELRSFTAQTSGSDFWGDDKDDIYQEYLPKPNIKKSECTKP